MTASYRYRLEHNAASQIIREKRAAEQRQAAASRAKFEGSGETSRLGDLAGREALLPCGQLGNGAERDAMLNQDSCRGNDAGKL